MIRKLRSTFIGFALAAILVAGVTLPAQAAFLYFDGRVDSAAASNPWGITEGSVIDEIGLAEWNSDLLTKSGDETLSFLDDPLMSLTFNVGTFSFASTDLSWSFFDLVFGFENGFLSDISLLLADNSNSSDMLDITGGDIDNFYLGDGVVYGHLFIPDFTAPGQGVEPVPEPGTFLLLGAGLGGLFLVRRRQKKA